MCDINITRENVGDLLDSCHGALMRIWNQYRDQMYQRGFETAEATQEVAARVLENRESFRGTTQAEFCAWSRCILINWILAELRRNRPVQMDSGHDTADSGQQRPSEAFQDDVRYAAYQLARAALPEHERVLIELRYEEARSVAEVSERLQRDHPEVWQTHQAEWDSRHRLDNACQAAEQHLNDLARGFFRELEGGSPGE
jgi:RNA polymerase sigma factor (sigma-70 family)